MLVRDIISVGNTSLKKNILKEKHMQNRSHTKNLATSVNGFLRSTILGLFCALTLTTFVSATAQSDNPDTTLLQGLSQNDEFSILLDLLEEAGLSDVLSSGEYTLFAPTNDAFVDLTENLDASLRANPDVLTQILANHVIAGRYGLNELQDANDGSVISLADEPLTFNVTLGGLTVNGASIDSTDVGNDYANGVLHELGDVILPRSLQRTGALEDALLIVPVVPTDADTDSEITEEATDPDTQAAVVEVETEVVSEVATEDSDVNTADVNTVDVNTLATGVAGSLITLLEEQDDFSELVAALQQVDLRGLEMPFTLFAPTDEAFATLDESELAGADTQTLLLYHILPGKIMSGNLVGTAPGNTTTAEGERRDGLATTLEGRTLLLTLQADGTYTLNNERATVIEADIVLDDNDYVVHVIDAVLLPTDMAEEFDSD
jgi:uncharacterized surface protein with fasciclin (FAS1) repeats